MQQIQGWFTAVDTDRSGQISAQELHRCLGMGGNNFEMSTIHKLIFTFDNDYSGQVGLHEFVAMHKYLQSMRECFQFFDRDRSGTLDGNELLQALQRGGYNLTQHALYAAMPKFDKERKGSLTFAQYIDFVIFLGNLQKLFAFFDPNRTGNVMLNFDKMVACTPYFN